jgi:hypothetical protein
MALPRQIDAIVEDQIKRWLVQDARPRPERRRPIVTISRQFGARGAHLARLVADALGFHFWDRELLVEVAYRAHAPVEAITALDEHRRNPLEPLTASAVATPVTTTEYRAALELAIRSIADRGSAIVVGRGAYCLVPPDGALRVRVVSDLGHRVADFMRRRGLDEATARAEIAETEADRRAFVKELYGRDVDDPAGFDLMVNTGTLTLEQARDVVVAAYRAKFSG